MAKLKQIVVDNFSYPFSGSHYLKIDAEGVIDANAAVTYGTTYGDETLVALPYLRNYVAAAIAAAGGSGGEGGQEISYTSPDNSITVDSTLKTLTINSDWISSAVKTFDWNGLLNNASKKVLSTLVSGWGFKTTDTQYTFDSTSLSTDLNTTPNTISVKSSYITNTILGIGTHSKGQVLKINNTNDGLQWGAAGIESVNLSDVNAGTDNSSKLITVGTGTTLTTSIGNGFVKVANGVVSYDNSTYLTTADLTQANIYAAVAAIIQKGTSHSGFDITKNSTAKTITITDTGDGSGGGGKTEDNVSTSGTTTTIGVKTDWLNGQILSYLSTLTHSSTNNTLKINDSNVVYWGQDYGGTGGDGNTTYTIVAGNSTGTKAVTNNGNSYITVKGSDGNNTQFVISGAQNVSVATDVNGNVTITGPNLADYFSTVSDFIDLTKKDYLIKVNSAGTGLDYVNYSTWKLTDTNSTYSAADTSLTFNPASQTAGSNTTIKVSEAWLTGKISSYLSGLDGAAAGQVLKINDSNNGFIWATVTTGGGADGNDWYKYSAADTSLTFNPTGSTNKGTTTIAVNTTWLAGWLNDNGYADTNDHMSTYMYVNTDWNGTGTPGNSTSDQADPYIFLVEKYGSTNTKTNSIQIKAGTDISVKAKNGVITIGFTNSSGYKTEDHDHTYSNGDSSLTFTPGSNETTTVVVNTTWLEGFLTDNNYTINSNISSLVKEYLSGITGHAANKILKINSSNNDFEWVTLDSGGDITSTYLLNNVTGKGAGKVLKINSSNDGLVWTNDEVGQSGSSDGNTTYSNGTGITLTGADADIDFGGNFSINTEWLDTYLNGKNYLTDHWVHYLRVNQGGANTIVSQQTSNTNTYLRLIENGSPVADKIQLSGGGTVSVSATNAGVITLSGKQYKLIVNDDLGTVSKTNASNPYIILNQGGTNVNDKVRLSGGTNIDISNTLANNVNTITISFNNPGYITSYAQMSSYLRVNYNGTDTTSKSNTTTYKDVYIVLNQGGTNREDKIKLVGTGGVSISNSYDGTNKINTITINSTDHTYEDDNRLTQLTGTNSNVFTIKPGANNQILSTTLVNSTLSAGWVNTPAWKTTDNDTRYKNETGDTSLIFGVNGTQTVDAQNAIKVNINWLNTQISNYITTNNIPTSHYNSYLYVGAKDGTTNGTTNTTTDTYLLHVENGVNNSQVKLAGTNINISSNGGTLTLSGAAPYVVGSDNTKYDFFAASNDYVAGDSKNSANGTTTLHLSGSDSTWDKVVISGQDGIEVGSNSAGNIILTGTYGLNVGKQSTSDPYPSIRLTTSNNVKDSITISGFNGISAGYGNTNLGLTIDETWFHDRMITADITYQSSLETLRQEILAENGDAFHNKLYLVPPITNIQATSAGNYSMRTAILDNIYKATVPGYKTYSVTTTGTDPAITAYVTVMDEDYYDGIRKDGYRTVRDVVAKLLTNGAYRGNTDINQISGFVNSKQNSTVSDSIYTTMSGTTLNSHAQSQMRYASESTVFKLEVNPEWIISRLCTAFTPFPGYDDNSSDNLSAISILNRRGVKGLYFDQYEQWRDNNAYPWEWRGNEDFPGVKQSESPQFWLSTYTASRGQENYYHHRLTIFPTWFGQNLHEHLTSNDSGISSNVYELNTDLKKEKNSCSLYHYYSDFGIDTNWLDNRISTVAASKVGTYNYTANSSNSFTLSYLSGDFLTGVTFDDTYARQALITKIPVGQGIIARFQFSANAAGAKIRFGGSSDTYNIIVAQANSTYYAGFVRYSDSKNVQCIGVRKVLGVKSQTANP